MNKEKIAIYEELIEFAARKRKPIERNFWQTQVNRDGLKEKEGYNQALADILSHLKGRIEEVKKDV